MKPTARINRINAEINTHFPTNNDAWWVSNETGADLGTITLHRGYGGDDIDPTEVARRIMQTERSVRAVYDNNNCRIYLRHAD